MRRRIVLTVFMVLVVLRAFSSSLFAQEKYSFEVGPYVSVADWQDRSFQIGPPQSSPPIKLRYHLAERPIYGVRANILSYGHWAGELAYAFEDNTVTLTRGATSLPLEGGVHHFFYNEVFYPVRYGHTIMPFFTGGIGVAGYHLNEDAQARARAAGLGELKGMDSEFAFNYGGGVKVNITQSFGVRGDFRHNFSDVPTFGLPKSSRNPAQPVLPVGGKLQMYEGSVGIYFRFMK
jgi:hypothetical protein